LVLVLATPDALLRVPVAVTCRVLGFSKRAFYQWKRNPLSRGSRHMPTSSKLLTTFKMMTQLGYRFIGDELAYAEIKVTERRVWKLCAIKDVYSN